MFRAFPFATCDSDLRISPWRLEFIGVQGALARFRIFLSSARPSSSCGNMDVRKVEFLAGKFFMSGAKNNNTGNPNQECAHNPYSDYADGLYDYLA